MLYLNKGAFVMKKIYLILLSLCILTQAQTQNLTPTELESARLAKLKSQSESYVQQLQSIETQMQALNILKQLTQEHQQQKYSEFLGEASKIKEAHKEWGESSKINFNPQQ